MSVSVSSSRLVGRRVLVTGGASGIGREIAVLCVAEGAQVVVLDRDEPAVPCDGVAAVRADVCRESEVCAAVEQAAQIMGGLDAVVNAAGVSSNWKLADLTLAEWERVMAINMTGTFLVCRAALPYLRQASSASIVNIASAAALRPAGPGHVAYAASKGAVLAFTKAIAHELAPGVRANVVCPGMTETPMTAQAIRSRPEIVASQLLGRVAQPQDIARTVIFLLSDESSFTTGATFAVDGGRTMY
ncbi:MAG: SDR family NAD(P)-dependent oxidoreductase [Burkholderiaceae bacterium]|nr:SDR family NAD(P)-dependent oxidoreductase [Burkholderiaceae bacterium]